MKIFRVATSWFSTGSKREEDGVTSIEYGLIATAIALLVAAGVGGLAPKVLALFNAIGT
ncbi:Flp family type IVb pilin [Aeromicrobium sp. 9AM]|uniref:Flp family type IVb pilin n=1 Tax=Aeromicrobium sp. 9AM TaxID=2653126 RepID=UPI0012EF5CE4